MGQQVVPTKKSLEAKRFKALFLLEEAYCSFSRYSTMRRTV